MKHRDWELVIVVVLGMKEALAEHNLRLHQNVEKRRSRSLKKLVNVNQIEIAKLIPSLSSDECVVSKGLDSISQVASLGVAKERDSGEFSDNECDRERRGRITGLLRMVIMASSRTNSRSGIWL